MGLEEGLEYHRAAGGTTLLKGCVYVKLMRSWCLDSQGVQGTKTWQTPKTHQVISYQPMSLGLFKDHLAEGGGLCLRGEELGSVAREKSYLPS